MYFISVSELPCCWAGWKKYNRGNTTVFTKEWDEENLIYWLGFLSREACEKEIASWDQRTDQRIEKMKKIIGNQIN